MLEIITMTATVSSTSQVVFNDPTHKHSGTCSKGMLKASQSVQFFFQGEFHQQIVHTFIQCHIKLTQIIQIILKYSETSLQ